MTEEYAVILSYRVWLWLWMNPGKRKEDCSWWALIKNIEAHCPCCGHYRLYSVHYTKCPLNIGNKELCVFRCSNFAYDRWMADHTNRAASGYIASKLRRCARRKNFNFEMEIVA
jgi:hypothetical protein